MFSRFQAICKSREVLYYFYVKICTRDPIFIYTRMDHCNTFIFNTIIVLTAPLSFSGGSQNAGIVFPVVKSMLLRRYFDSFTFYSLIQSSNKKD